MRLLVALLLLSITQFAQAGAVITYHGRLVAPSGDPVQSSNVSFNIRVLSPQTMGGCVLYEEQRTINMSSSDGVFVIPIGDGSGVRTANDPGFQVEKVFTNSAGTIFNKPSAWDSSKYFCNSGSSYSPSSLDGRQLVVSFKDGSNAWQVLPNMDVTFVPFAVSSYEAQNIGGTPSQNVLRVAGASAAPLSSAEYLELQKLIDGSSSSFGSGGSGSVTSVTAGSGLSGGTITNTGTIAIASGGVASTHLADSAVSNAKLASGAVTNDKVVSVDWTKITSVPTSVQNAGSDITSLQNSLATTNSNLGTTNTNLSNLTTTVGNKITQPSSCTSGQLLSFVSVTDWTCVNAPSSADKLALAGDTMSGALNMGANPINNVLTLQAGAVSTHTVVLSGTVPTTPPEGSIWYDAGVLKYRGPSSDLSLGTAGAQWQDVTNGLASTKLLGIGNNLPADGGYPNFNLAIDSKRDNASARGINTSLYQTSTANGAYSNLAGVFKAQEVVGENITNSGALSGVWSVAFRNNQPGFVDKGTLTELVGERVQYGHYNSEATGTPLTTEVYGVKLLPYYRTGTIGTMYDFYAHPGATGGTVTKHYGLHIGGAQKFNYIEGKLGVGTNSPTEALEVVGKVKASEYCIGASCITAWPSAGGSGTVAQVTAGTGLTTTSGATSSGGNITTTGSLYLTNTGVTAGTYGSATSVPVFEVDAQGRVKTVTSTAISGAAPTGSASGDLGGTYPSPTVDKIKGQSVSATATADGQVLRFSGSSWTPSAVRLSELASATGVAGSALNATGCSASQTLNWSSITDKLECQNIASLNASVLTAGTIDNARLPASATYWQAATGGINYAGGNVGVGTTTPTRQFLVASGTAAARGIVASYSSSTSTWGGVLEARSSRGTVAAPTALQSGDVLGQVVLNGYDGTTWDAANSPSMNSMATENWTSTNRGANLRFLATANGSANAVERMRIDQNGNIGIGTASPAAKLDLSGGGVIRATGDTAADGLTILSNAATADQGGMYLTNSAAFVAGTAGNYAYKVSTSFTGSATNSTLRFGVVNANAPNTFISSDLTLKGGKVGIGTATPLTSLDVSNSGGAALSVRDNSHLVTEDAFQTYIQGVDSANTVNWYVGDGSSGKLVGLMAANANYKLFLGTNGLERMIIDDSGKIGMGTTSPQQKLDVAGNIQIRSSTLMTASGDAGGLRIYNNQSNNSSDYLNIGWISEDLYGIQSADEITHKMLALNPYGGVVGVGTTAPNATFHIKSTSGAGVTSSILRLQDSGSGVGNGAGINFSYASSDTLNARIYASSVNGGGGSLGFATAASDGAAPSTVVTIGRDATYRLDVSGNIRTSGCVYYASSSLGTCASDERIKSDVHSFDLGLDTLLGIDPVYFKYNGLAGFKKDGQEQLGVIAQQVEKVAPALVKKQMVQLHDGDKEKTEIKVVDYGAFTYVIINAVKQLYVQLVGQEEQLVNQSRQIASIESSKADRSALAEANAKIQSLEAQNAEKAKELAAVKAYLCAKDPSAPICK